MVNSNPSIRPFKRVALGRWPLRFPRTSWRVEVIFSSRCCWPHCLAGLETQRPGMDGTPTNWHHGKKKNTRKGGNIYHNPIEKRWRKGNEEKPGKSAISWPFWDGENVTLSMAVNVTNPTFGDQKVTAWITWNMLPLLESKALVDLGNCLEYSQHFFYLEPEMNVANLALYLWKKIMVNHGINFEKKVYQCVK